MHKVVVMTPTSHWEGLGALTKVNHGNSYYFLYSGCLVFFLFHLTPKPPLPSSFPLIIVRNSPSVLVFLTAPCSVLIALLNAHRICLNCLNEVVRNSHMQRMARIPMQEIFLKLMPCLPCAFSDFAPGSVTVGYIN